MSTISKENYLKAIYHISVLEGSTVPTSRVAEKLEISNAATSEMAKKLAEMGLISYTKYKGVELTGEGEKIALGIIRRHRLWELFLIEVLGLSWSEVHDEAERLEHHSSELLVDKIDEYLKYPEFDPHGDPIPQRNGILPNMPDLISLDEAPVGKCYKIIRVDDGSSELMKYFTQIGLLLHKKIRILRRLEYDDSVMVSIDAKEFTLSKKISNNIFVTFSEAGN
jgi:DtxR family Mn-dependent transcriptional regulator